MAGYDKERAAERPTGGVVEVTRLAEAIQPCYRALILFAAFTGLRWGELIALRACDVDLEAGTVRVWRKIAELQDGTRLAGPPKSEQSQRTVALPARLIEEVRTHLETYPAGLEEPIFRGPLGAALRRNNFAQSLGWGALVAEAGLPPGFGFHDLRHTGNTLAAASGARTRELTHRMVHSSVRAALIYQHAASQRDHEIAAAMDQRIAREVAGLGPIKAQPPPSEGRQPETNASRP